MRILIVDDSQAMRRIVVRSLRQAGFDGHEVLECENGKIALETTTKLPPDLILSDWNMPEMNGIEFLAALRAGGSRVPFGFVTTESTMEMREKAITTGANFILNKPFTPEQMAAALSAYIK
jgi:two-component system, chemotaxis family, chemotaxis protein CheY